jgi:RNA-dependent RNA polymerase
MVGQIAILHLRISDTEGYDHPDCIKLAEKASHAVDFPKVGVPVNFSDLPRPRHKDLRPDFLSGEGVDPTRRDSGYYPSKKILGKLYRRIPDEELHYRGKYSTLRCDFDLLRRALSHVALDGVFMSSLLCTPPTEMIEEMESIFNRFCDDLFSIAQIHTVSSRSNIYLSEAEVVSGTSLERYADHRKRKETVAAMTLQVTFLLQLIFPALITSQTQELCKAIRQSFRDRVRIIEDDVDDGQGSIQADQEEEDEYSEDEDLDEKEELISQFRRAWTAWTVAEEHARYDDEEEDTFGAHSFGILALGTMLETLRALRKL